MSDRRTLHLPKRRENRPGLHSGTRPYVVTIAAGPKSGVWGRYSSERQAAAIVEALRRCGLEAVVERDEGASI